MKKILTTLCALMGVCSGVLAEVKLPAFFSNNMVMQQNAKCNLWGTADAGKTIAVKTSWNGKTIKVKADADGKWKAEVVTPKAGGPYSITFNDGKETKIENILMGEVWFCAGQSNMDMPMKGYNNQPVEGANDDLLRSKNNQIRMFKTKQKVTIDPQTDVTGEWWQAEAKTVRNFSATAYYFGRMLQEQLGVPVGLVVSAWGGSACEAWMKREWLKAFPTVKLPETQSDVNKTKQRCPSALYNGMLNPFIGMRIAGAIWYQGEDNWPRYQNYADLFSTMVKGWREEWGQGDFPFYYCQIAPFDYARITAADQDTINSAFLREQQMKAEKMIPNCGMAVLMDIGQEKGIHPMKKRQGGERLARLALVKTYGMEGITAESPVFSGIEIKGDTVICSFDRDKMWIHCHDEFASKHFEVAGEDRVFYPAKAWIARSKMKVKSDKVKKPVAVRYAFKDFVVGDVYHEDLPLSSFRSDDW